MKSRIFVSILLTALGTFAVMAETTSSRTCIAAARDELQSCSAECINDFRNERFTCRNVEPGCGRECLGRREGCLEAATEPLVECQGGCRSTLTEAKAACATTCGGDATCLDPCIDAAQVDAFTCRDTCREEFRMTGGPAAIEVCRATYRECVRGRPPAR